MVLALVSLVGISLIFPINGNAQQSWVNAASFPGDANVFQYSFTLNGKAYIGGGNTIGSSLSKQLWEFDPTTGASGSWQQKNNPPINVRMGAFAFSIGNYGYVGAGSTNGGANLLLDFWRYDPVNDSWIQLPDLTMNGRIEPTVCVIGNNAYIIGGISSSGGSDNIWRYEPNPMPNGTWTNLGSTPTGLTGYVEGFAEPANGIHQGRIFSGMGIGASNCDNRFWMYDIQTAQWTQVASLPSDVSEPNRTWATGGTLLNSMGQSITNAGIGFVGLGSTCNNNTRLSTIYQFTPPPAGGGQGIWTPLPSNLANFPITIVNGRTFTLGNNVYIGFSPDSIKAMWQIFSENEPETWCENNQFRNGDFELGEPTDDHQDINLADGWLPIWQSGSLADFYREDFVAPQLSSLGVTPPCPPTGNYAGCWISNINEGNDATWREGMFGTLLSTININTGTYTFSFEMANLYQSSPDSSVVAIYGIHNPTAQTGQQPTGSHTPTNIDLFGSSVTMLLGTISVSTQDTCLKQNYSITFSSSDLNFPVNGITHILITRSDSIRNGKAYCAFDNFCMQLSEPVSECIDFEDESLENWRTYNIRSMTIVDDSDLNSKVFKIVDGSGASIAVNDIDFSGNWLERGQDGCLCFDYKVIWEGQGDAGSMPKVQIYTGSPYTSPADQVTRVRAALRGDPTRPLLSNGQWDNFCLPIGLCQDGQLPSNDFGTWNLYDNTGTIITDPVELCIEWNNLIQNVTGLVLANDYNSVPSEEVYFDNFCWTCDVSCDGDEIGEAIIDTTCCSAYIPITNVSESDITEIRYSINGGQIKHFDILGTCSTFTTSPTPVYGSSSGTITFTPACDAVSFNLGVEVLATQNPSTLFLEIVHANGTICKDSLLFTCKLAPQLRCDSINIYNNDWAGNPTTDRSGKVIEIVNLMSPPSDICSIEISTSTLPKPSWGAIQWDGGSLYVNTDSDTRIWDGEDLLPPTSLYFSSIHFLPGYQGTPPSTGDLVHFVISIPRLWNWSGDLTIKVIHCDGRECEHTVPWCARPDMVDCMAEVAMLEDPRRPDRAANTLFGGGFEIPGSEKIDVRYAAIIIDNLEDARFLAISSENMMDKHRSDSNYGGPAILSSRMTSAGGFVEFSGLRSSKDVIPLNYMIQKMDSTNKEPIDMTLILYNQDSEPVSISSFKTDTPVTSVMNDTETEGSVRPYLLQPHPNPTSIEVNLGYWLPTNEKATMDIYNSIGERVITIDNISSNQGFNNVNFSTSSLITGTYLVKLTTQSGVASTTFIVAR
jgi:hypothetical protein